MMCSNSRYNSLLNSLDSFNLNAKLFSLLPSQLISSIIYVLAILSCEILSLHVLILMPNCSNWLVPEKYFTPLYTTYPADAISAAPNTAPPEPNPRASIPPEIPPHTVTAPVTASAPNEIPAPLATAVNSFTTSLI